MLRTPHFPVTYFPFLFGRWDKALAAAVLDALLVRLSRRTFEAAVAAFEDVTLSFDISTASFLIQVRLVLFLYYTIQ